MYTSNRKIVAPELYNEVILKSIIFYKFMIINKNNVCNKYKCTKKYLSVYMSILKQTLPYNKNLCMGSVFYSIKYVIVLLKILF